MEATAQACRGCAAAVPRAFSLAGKRHGWAGLRRAGGATRPGGARQRLRADPLGSSGVPAGRQRTGGCSGRRASGGGGDGPGAGGLRFSRRQRG
jgi:hypothetical protein